jgi:hypothetical protein
VAPRRLFALDQNFPEPIVRALGDFLDCAELVPVRRIDESMPRLEDWELLAALARHSRPWDGLITSDDSMLNDARAMTVLKETRLTLVIAQGQGHNPIRATGLVFCHLDHICAQTHSGRAQVWTLRASQKNADDVTTYLGKIAHREKISIDDLLVRHAVAPTDARADSSGGGESREDVNPEREGGD